MYPCVNAYKGQIIKITNVQITESSTELPYIPFKMIVPTSNIEIDNSKLNFIDYSYAYKELIFENISEEADTKYALYASGKSLNQSSGFIDDYVISSNTYKNILLANSGDNTSVLRLTTKSSYNDVLTFQQLLIYNGDLSQEELEKERNKNIKMYEIYKNE